MMLRAHFWRGWKRIRKYVGNGFIHKIKDPFSILSKHEPIKSFFRNSLSQFADRNSLARLIRKSAETSALVAFVADRVMKVGRVQLSSHILQFERQSLCYLLQSRIV